MAADSRPDRRITSHWLPDCPLFPERAGKRHTSDTRRNLHQRRTHLDANGGWKGRGLWVNYGTHFVWHIEGGKGEKGKVVQRGTHEQLMACSGRYRHMVELQTRPPGAPAAEETEEEAGQTQLA